MIKNWLKDKKEGRPLWLAECRAEASESTDTAISNISVISDAGENLSFPIHLPKVESDEEIQLMYKYLDGNRVNAAMLLGQNDNTDCAMPDTNAILKKIRDSRSFDSYFEMPPEPLICGVSADGNDIKLILCEGDRIRRMLSYDWNPAIATEDAMIINPIVELVEMAANGMKLDGIGLSIPNEYKKDGLTDALKSLVKEGAPVKILSDGAAAAFSIYNELKRNEAGKEIIKDGLIALPISADIGFGWVKEDGQLSVYPGNLSKCVYRFDNPEDSGFLNQEKVLKSLNMPVNNPKPCIDLLINMAEGGEANAEETFKNIGLYLGHAIREINYFMKPKTNKFFLLGPFIKSEYAFDLICLGLQKIAPDATVLQLDASLANSPIMKAVAEISDEAVLQFAQAIGCIYYIS